MAEDYRVWFKERGRGGQAYYEETSLLTFDMEMFTGPGTTIYARSPEEWDAYYETHQAPWAKGRRAEILDRLGKEMLRKFYGAGKYSVEEHWVYLVPARWFFKRLIGRFRKP